MSALKDGETFPMYCDPSRKLYETLDMVYNLKRSEKPEYMTTGLVMNVLSSMKNMVMAGGKVVKGGAYIAHKGDHLRRDICADRRYCRRLQAERWRIPLSRRRAQVVPSHEDNVRSCRSEGVEASFRLVINVDTHFRYFRAR